MKKTAIHLIPAALALFSLSSCLNTDGNEIHTLSITYPDAYENAIYADQISDSIIFNTSESCTMKAYDSTWLTIPEIYKNIQLSTSGSAIYNVSVPIKFQANTTGLSRQNIIYITPTSSWNTGNSIAEIYNQAGWLNIKYPVPTYTTVSTYVTKATFENKADSATQAESMIQFTTHGDWTLTCDSNSYAHPSLTNGTAGTTTIILTLDKNDSYTDTLRTTFYLTSNGVTTPIKFKKSPRKKGSSAKPCVKR